MQSQPVRAACHAASSCPSQCSHQLPDFPCPPLPTAHPGLVMESAPLIIVLKPLLLASRFAHHGRAVVVVLVAWLPGLEAAPAEPMVTSGTGHVQTPLILLNGRLTAGTAFGDELGQVLALGLHTHAIVVATVVHPLGHVATAGRIVCLREVTAEARGPATLRAGGPTAQALAAQDAIAALGVGAPCQVGAALHITSQKGLLVLWAEASCYEW